MIPDYQKRWDEHRNCFVSRSKRVWKNVAPAVNKIELIYTFTTPEPESRTFTRVLHDYTRYSKKEELESRLLESGFEVADLYSDYNAAPFNGGSRKMIFLARKQS